MVDLAVYFRAPTPANGGIILAVMIVLAFRLRRRLGASEVWVEVACPLDLAGFHIPGSAAR